ncbi:MAG: glycosyltransferase family 39 protein, partial [Desulfatitalea sp.]
CRDWVVAGRFVSLAFSFATLFPLYFLLRRFFDKPIATITLLVYALIPSFISRSADIVRDPVFWFLICSGMLMFVRHIDNSAERRSPMDLLVSCCLFMLAAWTRIEGVAFILASGVYLSVHKSDNRLRNLFFFSLPVLLAIIAVMIGALWVDRPLKAFYRTDKIYGELTQFSNHYNSLRDQLKDLSKIHPDYFGEFLGDIRTVVWMVPFVLIFNTLLEGFFYPYALIFMLGLIGFRGRWSQNRHLGYFVCLLAFSLVVLYIHLLQTWLIYNRFLAILIYPSFLFVGYGIENTLAFLKNKWNLKPLTATAWVVVFILAFGLGKNIRPNHEDKIIFRQAGEIIARHKAPDQVARIAGMPSTVYEWVFFYAHRYYPGALCTRGLIKTIPTQYANLIEDMRTDGIRYLFYEEDQWPKQGFDLMAAGFEQNFTILGRWQHKDTGILMLLELKNS